MQYQIHYKPLSATRAEARFLEIQPADRLDDPLVCRLVTLPLSDPGLDFVAVSALVGDISQREQFYVNRAPKLTTANIGLALRHVRAVFFPALVSNNKDDNSNGSLRSTNPSSATSTRSQGPPKQSKAPSWLRALMRHFGGDRDARLDTSGPKLRVWIDCICMDPSSAREQARRKIFMYHVYQKATTVVGWVGPKIQHTDLAVQLIRAFDAAMPQNWQDPGDKAAHPENYSPWHEWARPVIHLFDPTSNAAAGTVDFLTRDFFQRNWLLEEMAMAKVPSFLIGDSIVSWRQMLRLNLAMEEFKDYPSNVCPATTRPHIHELPLHTIHQLLDEVEKRKKMERVESLADGGSTVASTNGGSYR